jgi:hypothetical protein
MSSKSKEPTPPSVEQTSAQAMQAQISNLPEMLKAQQQYGPQFTQQYLSELQQFAPQLLGFQRQMESEYTPELASARKVLDEYFAQEQQLTPYEERQAKETFRSGQAARGMAQTGMGAQEELRGLTALRQQLKSQRLGLAMQMAGMGSPQTAAMTTMSPVANLGLQNVNPAQTFGLTQSNYQSQMNNQQQGGFSVGGALGGGLGAGIGAAGLFATPFTGGASTLVPMIAAGAGTLGGGMR